MELISDILLIAGALGAGFYCVVLSRRLNRFTNLDKGVGGAIAVLSAQVDDMTRALTDAQGSASSSNESLAALTERAEGVAGRLELLVASMHDLPQENEPLNDQDAVSNEKPGEHSEDRADTPVLAFARDEHKETSDDSESLFRSQRSLIREAAE